MTDVSISEMTYTMLSLLFLLLGIVLIVSIIMAKANPYDSIAFANVEKLRAAMDEVCTTGEDLSIKFELPQNTPKLTTLFSILPIWIIRTNGDPNYVLYYESYPPGDAIGWEIMQQMQNRLVTNVPDGFDGKTVDDVNKYVDRLRQSWVTKVAGVDSSTLWSKNLEGITVDNIVLGGPRTDYYLGSTVGFDEGTPVVGVGPENALAGAFKYGKWKKVDENDQPVNGDNTFIFNNYATLNSFEKSAIKYEACGDNSLCFKTRSGVYRYPLDQCKGIKYVELKYDARNRKVIYGGLAAAAVVAAGGWLILGAGGGVAGVVGEGGVVSAGVLADAAPIAPGVYAATTAAGETIPIFTSVAADGTIVAYTTEAATASTGSSIWSIIAGFFTRNGWKVASGFVKQLVLHPIRTVTIGIGSGIGVYKIGEFVAGAFLSFKIEDFNIASSCKVNQMTIKKRPCNQLECTKFNNYPIYTYGTDGKLHNNGEQHYTCTEKVNTDIDTQTGGKITDGQCLQVVVEEKADGFCWTPDPWTASTGFWDISDTRGIAELLEFTPVHSNTAFISSANNVEGTILKSYPLSQFESWLQWFERRISWEWPG